MVGILDIGLGNIGSVARMVERVGHNPVLISNSDQLLAVNKLILPGVGKFDRGIDCLQASGLISSIISFA